MTPLEKRRIARKAAMPEVKKLVRRFGRANISHCIAQLMEQEKVQKRLADLRKEVARLSKSV